MKLRILALNHFYPPATVGGMQFRLKLILEDLEKRGHEYMVLTSRTNRNVCPDVPNIVRTLRSDRDDTHSGGPYIYWLLRRQLHNVYQLSSVVESYKPDIIYAWYLPMFSQSVFVYLAGVNIPTVFSFGHTSGLFTRNSWPLLPSGSGSLLQGLKAAVWRRAFWAIGDHLHLPTLQNFPISYFAGQFNTRAHLEYYQGLDFQFGRTAVIHNGVDVNFFRPISRICSDSPVALLFLGRLTRGKGVMNLVTTMEALDDVDAALTIVGEGPELGGLVEECKRRNLLNRVTFRSFVDRSELPSLFSKHDAFLVPQRPALDGLTIDSSTLEAGACGLTLVLENDPGHRECFGSSNAALLCNGPLEMAEKIRFLVKRPDIRNEFGERARRLIAERFTSERMVSESERFLWEAHEAWLREHGRGKEGRLLNYCSKEG